MAQNDDDSIWETIGQLALGVGLVLAVVGYFVFIAFIAPCVPYGC